MPGLFRAYAARGVSVPSYFIESTAPLNVDDRPSNPPLPPELVPIEPQAAIDEIVGHLQGADEPNLVVMVHGYNNPVAAVLQLYAGAAKAMSGDPAITHRPGLVCIGYRWPSESLGAPLASTFAALPSLLSWLLWPGLILVVLGWLVSCAFPPVGHIVSIAGFVVLGVVAAAALLRYVVYFRDSYRAANYGAPDLIEIIRQIDRHLHDRDLAAHADARTAKENRNNKRVQLSFIGHSMGAFVVTNAIRALTDLFEKTAQRPQLNSGVLAEGAAAALERTASENPERLDNLLLPPEIGNVFTMMRFVLVSPDIPAGTLLSNRANYLASSLRRFREAYLFSNEGDEVLRQVSTVANFFSFPTKSWKFGFRLGNVEILSNGYGLISPGTQPFLSFLRIGFYTLQEVYENLRRQRGEHAGFATLQNKLAEIVSYFDCTDYVEPGANGTGLLTFAKKLKADNPAARMPPWSHFHLLCAYLVHGKPNVHGGYFAGELCQQLIYRLACLGYAETLTAFGGPPQLSAACQQKQIRVLLSPRLAKPISAPS